MSMTLTVLAVVAQMAAAPAPPEELRREELMTALRAGGYTLLVRHARTDRSIPTAETPGYSPPLRAEQRNLTKDGERDVRLMAAVVRKYSLPISDVLSSPIYRCRETADAFGTHDVTMALRVFPTTAETAALVSAAPAAGTNRVLVTHHFVIEKLVPGISPGDIGESEAAVVRPNGDGTVELVGRITLSDWEVLAGGSAEPATPLAAAVPHSVPVHAPAAQQSPEAAAAAFHASRAGPLAGRYIEAFNTGDAARMRAFIETSLVAIADRPTEARLESYTRLFEEHGRLEVVGVESATADEVAVRLKSKRGAILLRVAAAPSPSTRAASVSLAVPGAGHR